MRAAVSKAFLLGAGLGTRLRPLTNVRPKPLIPVFHRPLIEHALDHCLAAGISEFAINTHHLPGEWERAFPDHSYRGAPLTFFHEEVLLETGGGLKNIEDWIGNEPVLVYNGDILTGISLESLLENHLSSDALATLALRSEGPALHVAVRDGRVIDIHHQLGAAEGTHQFTGVYCIDPAILHRIPPAEKVSIIPTFLELAREGLLGASRHDDGHWLDLGTRQAYLEAHHDSTLGVAIHPEASIDPQAAVAGSVVGPGATIEAEATVLNCVLWPGTWVARGAQLTNCIVYSSTPAAGTHHEADL